MKIFLALLLFAAVVSCTGMVMAGWPFALALLVVIVMSVLVGSIGLALGTIMLGWSVRSKRKPGPEKWRLAGWLGWGLQVDGPD